MDLKTLYLAIGLILLIIVNIILGSVTALLDGSFDRKKFWRGVLKGSIIALCFGITYLVGYLNQDVAAVTINGAEVNVLTAVLMIILAGYYYYAKQVIAKLSELVKGNTSIVDNK